MSVVISISDPCVQYIRADPVLPLDLSEVKVSAATCMCQPHVRAEPVRNERVSAVVYEEIHDIEAEEPGSHYV